MKSDQIECQIYRIDFRMMKKTSSTILEHFWPDSNVSNAIAFSILSSMKYLPKNQTIKIYSFINRHKAGFNFTVQTANMCQVILAFAHLMPIWIEYVRMSSNFSRQFWLLQLGPVFYQYHSKEMNTIPLKTKYNQ